MLKCPESECDACIFVSLLRYPKYNKTKRPRRGAVLSNTKWYVYALQSHLIKNHKTDHDDGTNDDNAADANSIERMESIVAEKLSSSENEDGFRGFRSENHESTSNRNERRLTQRIENDDIPENDGEYSTIASTSNQHVQNLLKRKIRVGRAAHLPKKQQNNL